MTSIMLEKEKLDAKKKKIQLQEKLLKEKEKRKQSLRFEEIGKIAAKANIDSLNSDIILGAFLEISEKMKEKSTIENWKLKAEKYNESIEKANDSPISISFKSNLSSDTKQKLKDANFKWNRFRKEFYGFGKKSEIEKLFQDIECNIEVLN